MTPTNSRVFVRWTLGILTSLVLVAGCVVQRSPVTGNKRAYAYTWQQEIQIGQQSDPAIVAQYGLYDDQELAAYVDRIGQKVLAESHLRRPDTPQEFRDTKFTFRVLDSPVVNAFALPGGYIYVTRGLLAHVKNEAQLAVVLGHEVGHVAGRHASKRALQQQLGMGAVIAGAVAGQAIFGVPGQDVLNAAGTAAQLMFLRYGRDDERESDDLGVEYAALSDYQAGEGAYFFTTLKRLSDKAGAEIPSFLSTHPDPGEREQTILRLAAEWAKTTPMTIVNEREHLNLIDGIVLGEDPRQGYVENGVFYHPELTFQFPVPTNWTVINQPTQVGLIEPNQNAVLVFTLAQDVTSARDAASKFAAQEGLTVVSQGAASSGYLPAQVVVADATTQDGTVVRVMARFIEYGGNIYSFIGYAARASFSTYQNALTGPMVGFNSLTDRSKIDVQPTRLDVVNAPRTATFTTLVPSTLPRGVTAEDLAIMNQVGLTESVPAGRPLKLAQ